MPQLKLFHFPGACSRVTMTALEHVGCSFEDEMVDLLKQEHLSASYQSTNPRGKVPALLIDGVLLSENAAILTWLDETFPDAGLLPTRSSALDRAQVLSDLFWVSSVWHPYVRANKMPIRWTTGDIAPVRERGKELLAPQMKQLNDRLSTSSWWFGEDWSIIDVYFYWAYTTAEEGEFDLSPFAHVARHRKAVEALPAFKAALAREQAAIARRSQ